MLVYCRWGFVHPATDPDYEGWYFDSDAISAIRWAEYLRTSRGVNLPGVRVIFQMVEEVGRKRSVTGDGLRHRGEVESPLPRLLARLEDSIH